MKRLTLIVLYSSVVLMGCSTTNLGQNGTLYHSEADKHGSWNIVSGTTIKITTTTGPESTTTEDIQKKVFLCAEPTPRITKDEKKNGGATVTANANEKNIGGAAAGTSETKTASITDEVQVVALRELTYAICQLSVNISSVAKDERPKIIALYEKLLENSKALLDPATRLLAAQPPTR